LRGLRHSRKKLIANGKIERILRVVVTDEYADGPSDKRPDFAALKPQLLALALPLNDDESDWSRRINCFSDDLRIQLFPMDKWDVEDLCDSPMAANPIVRATLGRNDANELATSDISLFSME
jgi:hypothetical protein